MNLGTAGPSAIREPTAYDPAKVMGAYEKEAALFGHLGAGPPKELPLDLYVRMAFLAPITLLSLLLLLLGLLLLLIGPGILTMIIFVFSLVLLVASYRRLRRAWGLLRRKRARLAELENRYRSDRQFRASVSSQMS